jgi:hypothetical protein
MPKRFFLKVAATAAFLLQCGLTEAQQKAGNLIFFSPIIAEKDTNVIVKNEYNKEINSFKWHEGLPLLKSFSVDSGEYRIKIPGPVSSITITANDKGQTFLQVAPYDGMKGEQGVQITVWLGAPNAAIEKAISEFKKLGVDSDFEPTPLRDVGKVLYFNTEPPWPGPFGPTPNPPKPK